RHESPVLTGRGRCVADRPHGGTISAARPPSGTMCGVLVSTRPLSPVRRLYPRVTVPRVFPTRSRRVSPMPSNRRHHNVSVKIRLKRLGKIRTPQYRVVVMDSRTRRDGRAIEEIGKYHPKEEPSRIEIDSERAQYWLGVGAQPTEQVTALLKVT